MWGHHYSPTALRVAVVRDTESETGKTDRKEKALSGIHCDPFLIVSPTSLLHHCCPPCCRVITFPRKMRFAVPRRLMSPFNLGYWSTPLQNSNQAFLSLLFEGLSYLMFKCCWLWTCPVRVLIGRRISWATWGGSFPSSMLKVHSTSISQGQIG